MSKSARRIWRGKAGRRQSGAFRWGGAWEWRGRSVLAENPRPLTSMQAAFADRLVFAKIRDGLGGRIRYLVSGSAPLPVSVAEFFYGVGLRVIEGYGLTETAPILTVNPPEAPRAGTVGKAVEGVELRTPRTADTRAGPERDIGYHTRPATPMCERRLVPHRRHRKIDATGSRDHRP